MRRTTIFLEEALLKRAQRYAAKHGKSFAQVVREAVLMYITDGPVSTRGLPRLTGQFSGGPPDLSERVDELLWQDPR